MIKSKLINYNTTRRLNTSSCIYCNSFDYEKKSYIIVGQQWVNKDPRDGLGLNSIFANVDKKLLQFVGIRCGCMFVENKK